MAKGEQKHYCEHQVMVSQDGYEQCGRPAKFRMGGKWTCPSCTRFDLARVKEKVKEIHGILFGAKGED